MERRAAISAAGTRFTMKSRVRYLLIMLIFLVGAVVNIDRSNISIAGSFLAADYHISRIQLGWVFSAFMIGYAAFLIPAGWIAGRLGPRRTLTVGLVWWSALTVATALVPPTMANALWALIAVRFILGLGEALAYPSANQFIAAWFPSQERGKANALVQGGAQLGSGIAPPLVAFIIYHFGWHAAFYISAVIGLVIAVFWYWAARDVPARHPSVTPQEMAHIEAGLPAFRMEGPDARPYHGRRFFPARMSWSNGAGLCAGFGYAATIFSTWFFIYLKDGRGFDLKSSALLGMLPFIATTSCCLIGGFVSDRLSERWSPYIGRSLFGACTLLLSGVILMAGGHAQNGVAAALLLSGAVGALYLGQAVYYAVAADLGGPHTGVVSGLVSMCGQIAGAATASLTPFFASRYGWDQAFTIAAGVTLCLHHPLAFRKSETQGICAAGRGRADEEFCSQSLACTKSFGHRSPHGGLFPDHACFCGFRRSIRASAVADDSWPASHRRSRCLYQGGRRLGDGYRRRERPAHPSASAGAAGDIHGRRVRRRRQTGTGCRGGLYVRSFLAERNDRESRHFLRHKRHVPY